MTNHTVIWIQKIGSILLHKQINRVFCCSLLFIHSSCWTREQEKKALRVGFEPTREDPIGFLVQRLNHSAIAATLTSVRMKWFFFAVYH